jgi:hypothetical protein
MAGEAIKEGLILCPMPFFVVSFETKEGRP